MEAAMNDTILALCQRLQDIGWATALRESQFMFPVVEGIHLLGLAFILGPVLMLDFRLTGIAWRNQPVSKIAQSRYACRTRSGCAAAKAGSALHASAMRTAISPRLAMSSVRIGLDITITS